MNSCPTLRQPRFCAKNHDALDGFGDDKHDWVDVRNPNEPGINSKLDYSVPSLSLPKSGGAIRGIDEKFAANLVTGTANFSVPLVTSPGRSGFGPQLSVSYDSGSGNGPFGLGWSLSLPSITRRTDRGLPKYLDAEESDIFILSGSEDLVPILDNQGKELKGKLEIRSLDGEPYSVYPYRPRIEGLFARIERWTRQRDGDTHWRSISKDNITTLYGRDSTSRIADPQNPLRVFTWLICESYDDKGNAIVYSYVSEDSSAIDLTESNEQNRTSLARSANRYPKRIRYGNKPSTLIENDLTKLQWLFEVVFDYGEGDYEELPKDSQGREFVRASLSPTNVWPVRKDPFSNNRSGFEVRTYRLCRRVLMFHHFPDELGSDDSLVQSTEFAYDQEPLSTVSRMTNVTQSSFRREEGDIYRKRSLPSLDFEYSVPTISAEVKEVDQESLANLPVSSGANYQWLDLDGEGVQGILSEHAAGWYYKRNLSPLSFHHENGQPVVSAQFSSVAEVASLPSLAHATDFKHHFLDLAGDGQLDCVVLEQPSAGFFERNENEDWNGFQPLPSQPNVDWTEPNLRMVDLNGDGHADILITEDEVLLWYPSLAEEGYDSGIQLSKSLDENEGPTVVFAEPNEALLLADMSGDGLTDIVRIRDGEVCYWPNLGYGRFGRKVTMDNAPAFESLDQFDHRRLRLADIDGSGVTDIIYFDATGVHLYFNQSGNSWSDPETLAVFPKVDNVVDVQALDLLGNGTASLVWNSPLPSDAGRSMRYVDLMGSQKPHLLTSIKNNLGTETRLLYAPSTKFYTADRISSHPWLTRLPFPVQVVERVETYDAVSRNRFITHYAYHHGFFDGFEREFRGFGMVEQFDTEEIGALNLEGSSPNASNIDATSYVPPVHTKTWFHTGAYLEEEKISGHFEDEYYQESAAFEAMLLPDSVLPPDLAAGEVREALRSLKGAMLRQEVYALDDSKEAALPYIVSERNYTINRLQPFGPNAHAVFFTGERETIDFHYERKLFEINGQTIADPRVTHNVILSVDEFGNELQSVAIGYGRRHDDADPLLKPTDKLLQKRTHVTYSESLYTNPILDPDAYRAPLLAQKQTFELINVEPERNQPNLTNLFEFAEIAGKVALASDGKHDLPYDDVNAKGAITGDPYRRIIEHVRVLFRKDDLSGPLPLGQLESLALPHDTYKLALVPGLIDLYKRGSENLLPNATSVLRDEGKYVLSDDVKGQGLFPTTDPTGEFWLPSGQVFYIAAQNVTAISELANARKHFFLVQRYQDPFGNSATVSFDIHDLLALETEDELKNKTTAGERDTNDQIINRNDYRVLQPSLITDANGNRSEVSFDVLGLVAATAVMGKASENLGDSLSGVVPDLTQEQLDQFFTNPAGADATTLLGNASTRVVYDLDRFARSGTTASPVYAATIKREVHVSDLSAGETSRQQIGFAYSDGFGRVIQEKVRAETGPLLAGGSDVNPRWLVSGWTIFNNKGNPVRKYEPFFDDTHDFRFAVLRGVSPILFYDPVGRVVATLHPDHSWEKSVFDPWHQENWDANDTVAIADPKTDSAVGPFFERLPQSDYLPTWLGARIDGSKGKEEQDAAQKAAKHDETPTRLYVDSLGRTFLTLVHNRFEIDGRVTDEFYRTAVEFDIEGNQRSITDALDRAVITYDYDMLGTRLRQDSVDAGQRWLLNNSTGKPLRRWDTRKHQLRYEYDGLQRPTRMFVTEEGSPERLVERTIYGEDQPQDQQLNLRTRVRQVFDNSGVVTDEVYDFKGNLRSSNRQLLRNYREAVNWSASPDLEDQKFRTEAKYDALNRVTAATTPDASVTFPSYNERGLLIEINVNLRASSASTPFVDEVTYDAKGQRERIKYSSGASTEYSYDSDTFRMTRVQTSRQSDNADLQDLNYFYDPIGNITQIRDDAQQAIYFANQVVTATSGYVYDASYRLSQASGREHIGQVSQPQTTDDDAPRMGQPLPSDGQAMRNYTEMYSYDGVGNILSAIHQAVNGNWTRNYVYDEPNSKPLNNRLTSTSVGSINEPYKYDVHGNMVQMPHLFSMSWDFKDQLQISQRQAVNTGPGEVTYYVYDAMGQRVRKVTESAGGTRRKERIYVVGVFEIYREYDPGGEVISLERETLHVMDDKRRIALVETRTAGDDGSPARLIRLQINNQLGSACLELDQQSNLISYEEYYPYGSTSFQAVNKTLKAAAKRYRYTGKERDEETGLTYHGARYCAPWLGRWTSCDPAGLLQGTSLYVYCSNNPINMYDPRGTEGLWENVKSVGRAVLDFKQGQEETLFSVPVGIVKEGVRRLERTADELKGDPIATATTALASGPAAAIAQASTRAEAKHAWNQIQSVTAKQGGGAAGAFVAANELYNPAFAAIESGTQAMKSLRAGDYREAGKAHAETGIHIAETIAIADAAGKLLSPGASSATPRLNQGEPVPPSMDSPAGAPANSAPPPPLPDSPPATGTPTTASPEPTVSTSPIGGGAIDPNVRPDVYIGGLRRWRITPTGGSRGVTPEIREEIREWQSRYGTIDSPVTDDPIHAGHTYGGSHVFTPSGQSTQVAAETAAHNLASSSAEKAAAAARRTWNAANPNGPRLPVR